MNVYDAMCFCGFILLVFGGIAGLIYLVSKEDKDMAYIEFENKTNGDVLKTIFPNIEYGKSESKIYPNIFGWIENEEKTKDILMFQSDEEWWNAPYKREGIKPQERSDRK